MKRWPLGWYPWSCRWSKTGNQLWKISPGRKRTCRSRKSCMLLARQNLGIAHQDTAGTIFVQPLHRTCQARSGCMWWHQCQQTTRLGNRSMQCCLSAHCRETDRDCNLCTVQRKRRRTCQVRTLGTWYFRFLKTCLLRMVCRSQQQLQPRGTVRPCTADMFH